MALNASLKLHGQKTGPIRGSGKGRARDGMILVIAAAHDIALPPAGPAGVATGKRQHRPMVITKEVDSASPPLHGALANNETMKEWELQLWRPNAGGEEHYFTIRLTKAAIASIALRLPNTKVPDQAKLEAYEDVAFTYEKIEWIWVDGNISVTESWKSGV